MFAKLALRNVRRQIGNYLIYFVTVTLCVALLFAVNNLSYSDRIQALAEISSDMRTMFTFVTVLSCLVTALVLSYATGFMLKLRKKEFGMYLTLGMTRRNIQRIFACETGILSLAALLIGMGAGLVLFQLLVALFSSIMEKPFAVSAYSMQGILLTVAVSVGLFALSTLASMRYLKKVTVAELLKEEAAEKSEKHPILWGVVSILVTGGLVFCLVKTYLTLMAAFKEQEGLQIFIWLVLDLAMVFLFHAALSRSITGVLLRNPRLKNNGTNAVILRSLSGKMTMNSILIGALATLLVFAIGMCNVALAEKIYADYSVDRECPYDVMAQFPVDETAGISPEEGREIIEHYSPITRQMNYQLYSTGQTTLCRQIPGYESMGWTDTFLPLSRFNAMLTECGYEPVSLNQEYLLVTFVPDISEIDFSGETITLNDTVYSWGGSELSYPEFTREWFYFVVPDEAVTDLEVSVECMAYTLENSRIDGQALVEDLIYTAKTADGEAEKSNHRVKEYWRLYGNATAATLIIGTLYVSTVFVCMALAILSLKTLSTLEEERKRFAMLYRLGVDVSMQKKTLRRQMSVFFLSPFLLPLMMTVPVGVIFGQVYQIWNFAGLSGQRAMETAVIIALVIAGIYALYFVITYRIACSHVICSGGEKQEITS